MKKLLFVILLGAFLLRLYGINWDEGRHLHPDERQLIMVADTIHFWDKLDPHFYNYGSLPIYLVKGVAQLDDAVFQTSSANYDGLLYVGRTLSVIFDIGTLLVVCLIAKLLFKKRSIVLLSALLYAITFFTIQNSHFFVVDVFLTFFVTTSLYFLLQFIEKPGYRNVILLGVCFAAALATKVSAIIFLPVIVLSIIGAQFFKNGLHGIKTDLLIKSVATLVAFLCSTLLAHFVFMPYAYLSYSTVMKDILLQSKMSSDAYLFPYTLQYVGTLPYLYYLKNIALWGVGPVISLCAVVGTAFAWNHLIQRDKQLGQRIMHAKLLIVVTVFYAIYFLVMGRSAVKFMRYMLPLYPFIILIAAYGLEKIRERSRVAAICLIGGALIWTLSFASIYSAAHTRISATNWILQNVPFESSIAVEHWDDRLPIFGSENYKITDLTLYELPDDETKWFGIERVIKGSEYIIVASNRLYVPLQKLADCRKFKKCYPITAQYYPALFGGKLGFKKVAEFSASPHIPLLNIPIPDQSADESFTVYDHPKIMIFKRSFK